ncbi:MAG: 3-oxoacid CoA-transferase subunit B [Cyclobacteriaceae bacterium]
MADARVIIAKRAALEVKSGMIVNLGIGIPSMIPDYLDPSVDVFFQAENGVLGLGPTPKSTPDPNLINAAGLPVTVRQGGSYFDSAVSFGMIRKGFIELAILGALQVAQNGDLANWIVPGKRVPGVGGAMDLAYGAKNLIAVMTHCEKDGHPKILKSCTLPLTASACVKKIITEWAVFEITGNGLLLTEIMPDANLEMIRSKTDAPFNIDSGLN